MDNYNTEDYKIEIDQFTGPYSVLLSMIEERKLFINDISLALITEDYLKYVNNNNIHPVLISNFIMVASTLILIKSKSLLPNLDLTNEEEHDIKDLEERLKLYEMYSKLSLNLKENFGKNIIFFAEERKNYDVVFLPDHQITQESMMVCVSELLNKAPKKTLNPEVSVRKVISIEEMIDKIKDRIEKTLKTSFKDFAGKTVSKEERVYAIVGFLAMLELVREGTLHVVQDNNFEDITIQKMQSQSENDLLDNTNNDE